MGMLWTRKGSADVVRDRVLNGGSCVICPLCSWEIPLVGTLRPPGEFSALCPNCGHRNIYQSDDARDPKRDADAT